MAKPSTIEGLSSTSFAITDSHYGMTGELHRCLECGFLQCLKMDDVVSFYEELEDYSYEETREVRLLQARKILEKVRSVVPAGRLLDIGAGSGMLVQEAMGMGYQAEGVEPSKWLQQKASSHGLTIELGTFPHANLKGPYDIITLIDVIEHVDNPVQLLQDAREHLSPSGVVVVITPDLNSVVARLLGWRWWHFRVAHIGYFSRKTLTRAATRAGLQVVSFSRPSWYFTLAYLLERVQRYLPKWASFPVPQTLKHMTVPFNLRDSMMIISTCKR